jgi:hypothetical protein
MLGFFAHPSKGKSLAVSKAPKEVEKTPEV